MDHMHGFASEGFNNTPIPSFGGTHPWGQNGSLLTNGCPTPSDCGKGTDLGRVSEKQDQVRPGLFFQVSDLFFSLPLEQNPAYV